MLYQLFRGSVFIITLLGPIGPIDGSDLQQIAMMLAASSTSLVPALILLQLYLTKGDILLAPARVAKLIDTVASVFALYTALRGTAPIGLFSIVVLADLTILIFLLLFRVHREHRPLPHPDVEELEER